MMSDARVFCPCKNFKCPCNPVKNDQECTLCIQINLEKKEIPFCFFHNIDCDIDCENPTLEWHYQDFATLVKKAQNEGNHGRMNDASDAKDLCTCKSYKCNPVENDQKCTLCIQTSLKQKEIPVCFFHAIDCEKPTPNWYYQDYVALIEKARNEGKL